MEWNYQEETLMAEDFERIEKALEGNGLALSAVAEVLRKMDARLIKAEEDEEDRREEEDGAVEKAALVKELAAEVAGILKADQGMDVSGGERKAKSTGGSSSKADDSESALNIASKIEQQQNTIQAMSKADDDDEEEDDADGEMKSMQKELDSLRKQLASFEQGIEKSVEEHSEARLRKMGFREERGLVAPQISALGTDGTTPLVKSANDGDTVDQLANLSYGELRALQLKIQSGDTSGVPQELL
tara:strand:- start:1262 stop:1996 length:735 start_codon:yes stop_codon:yes gene_type:complete